MSRIRDAAAHYISLGFSVVPIRKGEKRPNDGGWLKHTYTAEDFDDTFNVGLKCGAQSGNLIDIDIDCDEALVTANHLLPKTGLIHGRASKLGSHHWYLVSAETAPKQFQDLDGSVLLEIRSTGQQTVVPPSVHTSGEILTWETQKGATPIDATDLRSGANAAAVAALFARHWPIGGRHSAAGVYAGFLLRCGFEGVVVVEIVRATAIAAKDEEVEDRVRFARETVAKHERGEKTTGGPSIIKTFERGKDLIGLVYSWVGREGDDRIEELNAAHFVARLGKDVVVGMEEGESLVTFQKFTDFQQLYSNQYIAKKKLGMAWLDHRDRREYRRVVFVPPGSAEVVHPDDYNLWRGYACEPEHNPDAIAYYIEHLATVICDGNEELAEYVLDLLADCAQCPGKPSGKALALLGKQGFGKSVFVESFAKAIFRNNWISVSHRDEIVGKFNSHLSGKVVVFADEAVWGGNRQDAGTLKKLVTQDRINIERKGIDKVTEPNCIHLFMASNEEWVWPAGDFERRGVIVRINEAYPNGHPYWEPLWREVEAPAFGPALLSFLLNRVVDYSRLRENPMTDALREQMDLTLDSERKWWKGLLDEGVCGWTGGWPSFVDQMWLWLRYQEDSGNKRVTRFDFINKMRRMLPPEARPCTRLTQVDLSRGFGVPRWAKERRAGFFLPPLTRCREWFDQMSGARTTWSEPPPMDESELPKELLDLANGEL